MTGHGATDVTSGLRLALAAVLGCAAATAAFVLGMPGTGAFVPTIWAIAFVAQLTVPGWLGFVALLGGVAVCATVLDVSDGTFGLVILIVVVVAALAAHGALTAAIIRHLHRLGWRLALRDERFVAGAGAAVGAVLVSAWVASDLARNPP